MTAFVVVFLVAATAIPAVGACCVARSADTTTMHMVMPCCATSCQMKAASTTSDRGDAIVAAAPAQPASPIAIAVTHASATVVATLEPAQGSFALDSSPPSPFLLHAQFRI